MLLSITMFNLYINKTVIIDFLFNSPYIEQKMIANDNYMIHVLQKICLKKFEVFHCKYKLYNNLNQGCFLEG